MKYDDMKTEKSGNLNITTGARVPIKEWTVGVPVEESARKQLFNTAQLPFIFRHIAVMPDVHYGMGSTIGSVIPTIKAIIPASVGVDIGCGVDAIKTTLTASQLPDNLFQLRSEIEEAVPHGRSHDGGPNDKGAWQKAPQQSLDSWQSMNDLFEKISNKYPKLIPKNPAYNQLGTLGGGNHYLEICIDESQNVWVMLHSGSRGIGNKIGSFFIEKAKREMEMWFLNNSLPDINLSYLPEGSKYFNDYIEAVSWAQNYAKENRSLMMQSALKVLKKSKQLPKFDVTDMAVSCHHNYISKERHFKQDVWITRKGAVNAEKGRLGVVPGSMGAKSFIVRGLGNKESFCSCSHGAGRKMSRTEAQNTFTLKDHREATDGVECRKDKDVIDETPGAYKDIEAVMSAQSDLVEIVHTLKQVVCIKG